jgi:hypothetical protein
MPVGERSHHSERNVSIRSRASSRIAMFAPSSAGESMNGIEDPGRND